MRAGLRGRARSVRPRTLLAAAIVTLAAISTSPARLGAASGDGRDILVVVNPNSSLESVTEREVRDVFLGRRVSWSEGGRAIPINAQHGTSLREEFRARVLDMDAAEEQRYWQDRQIRGGKTAPKEFGNALKAVFKLRDAVSYVYRESFREGVAKVVLVLPAAES